MNRKPHVAHYKGSGITLLVEVVLSLGTLQRQAGARLGTITLDIDRKCGLALDDQSTVDRLPALVLSLLPLLGDGLHEAGAIADNTLLTVEYISGSPVDQLTILVLPELGLDRGTVTSGHLVGGDDQVGCHRVTLNINDMARGERLDVEPTAKGQRGCGLGLLRGGNNN